MEAERQTIEVAITQDRIISITATPRDTFAVVKGLQSEGYNPQVRWEDDEVGITCWQPTGEIDHDTKPAKRAA